jgi:hypothetical protein
MKKLLTALAMIATLSPAFAESALLPFERHDPKVWEKRLEYPPAPSKREQKRERLRLQRALERERAKGDIAPD